MLLNLALRTSRYGFPLRASALTSPPMCSPSRSQSVQMNRARAPLALLTILVEIDCFSCQSHSVSSMSSCDEVITNVFDFHTNGSVKKCLRRRIVPISFVLIVELGCCQMSRHAGHEHIASSPWRTKIEREGIVLDELVSRISLKPDFG
jgi:hypothetical protein